LFTESLLSNGSTCYSMEGEEMKEHDKEKEDNLEEEEMKN
jgi:hypothetical protein